MAISLVMLISLSSATAEPPKSVPDEILVRFRPGRAQAVVRQMAAHGIKVTRMRKFRTIDWHCLKTDGRHELETLLELFGNDPDVLAVEPNYMVKAIGLPDDTRFSDLWGLHNTGQGGGTADADIDAVEAWDLITTSHVVVAVIDTGVDYTHEDLAANAWANPGEIADNSIDDDGNGYVDDVRGWDFANDDSDPMDGHGHGTHCAGTIGAVGDNARGVAGVCWQVRIMAVKFLSDGGWGATADAIDSVEYATAMGADVMNNSWGGGGYSQALKDAIDAAGLAGALFVAAAGNDAEDTDVQVHYPSSYGCSNIISVAATTRDDDLAYFSNYGLTNVDLAAPGAEIWSTVPNDQYGQKSGTSMATPHVAGACALVWGYGGAGMGWTDVKDAILAGVDVLPALDGKCATSGRLNLPAALDYVGTNRVIRVLSPDGGEGLEKGSTNSVQWRSFGQPWQPGDTVRIDYSPDAGSNWYVLPGATAVVHSTGSFAWDTTPLSVGTQYLLRVAFTGDLTVSNVSDDVFAIAGPLDHFDFEMTSPQANNRNVRGTCRVAARDSNEVAITTFATFNTAARFPVAVTAPGVTVGGLSGGDELAPTDFNGSIADLTQLGMTLAVASTPTSTLFTVTSADARTGISSNVLIDILPDHFTESFNVTLFDMTNTSLILIPDGGPNHYAAYRQNIVALPTDPSGGTVLALADDDATLVTLTNASSVRLYGKTYTRFYVGSNGYITFEDPDMDYGESIADHFRLPRISVLFNDFYPLDGQVTWKQLSDRVAVTYNGVREYGAQNTNTFQAELFFNGRLVLSYLSLDCEHGLAGISEGLGVPPEFIQSDLSMYPLLPNRLVVLSAPNGGEGVVTGTVTQISWAPYGDGWQTSDVVRLEYSDDGGTNWYAIPGGSNLTYDTGSFNWDTTGLGLGDAYRIRISAEDEPAVDDESLTDFSLIEDRGLLITFPNGGEFLDIGSTVTVTWAATGVAWQAADKVNLAYSPDAGSTWTAIPGTESLAYDAGTFDWDTTGLSAGADYYLKVLWPTNPVVCDVSDSAFGLRATYYVNDGSISNDAWCTAVGDDANPGTSPGAPKATVSSVLATYDLEPGARVRIDTGSYTSDVPIEVAESDAGSRLAPVTIEGSPYGTVIEGTNTESVWYIDRADYVTLRTADDTNFPARPQQSMRIQGGETGVELYGANYCVLDRLDIVSNAWGGVAAVVCQGLLCRDNNITYNEGIGLQLDYSYSCIVTGNVVRANADSGMELWDANFSVVRNNLILTNGWYGISDWSGNVLIENNTIARNDWAQIDVASWPRITIRNNIIWAHGEWATAIDNWSDDPPESDYNLFHLTGAALFGYHAGDVPSFPEWRTRTGQDMHSLARDPLLVDPAGGDYHLQSTRGSYHDGAWSTDPETSSGIDLGFGLAGAEPAPNSTPGHGPSLGRRNLGAYGGTAEASLTPTGRVVFLYEPIGESSYLDQATPIDIRWTWRGLGWSSNDAVLVEYSTNAGGAWATVLGGDAVPLTNGILAWTVDALPVSLDYRVRITWTQDVSVTDATVTNFRIGKPFVWYVNDGSTSNDEWCVAVGSDTNDGLRPDRPRATVQSILAECNVEPGDTIRIDTGYYAMTNDIELESWHSGQDGAPVTFEGSPYGVTLDRGNPGESYNRVWELWSAHDIIIRTVTGTSHPGSPRRWMRLTSGASGLYISSSSDRCIVERLVVCSNTTDGIYSYGDYLVCRNNVIRNNGGDGIELRFPTECTVVNNTIVNNAGKQVNLAYSDRYTNAVALRNNILQANGASSYGIYCRENPRDVPQSDFNLFWVTNSARVGYAGAARTTLADWRAETGEDANSLSNAPLFVAPAAEDYHLQSIAGSYHDEAWSADAGSSPGIDTGDPLIWTGLESAPHGSMVNLGAYGNTEQASLSADSDGDRLSDTFEQFRIGTDPDNPDTDGDIMQDGDERVANTDPLNPTSVLVIQELTGLGSATCVVQWQSASNVVYALDRSSNLLSDAFEPAASNIVSTPPINVYTDTVPFVPRTFYRIRVQ